MNDINRDRCCVETESYLNSIDQRKKEALKNIGCSVECGYVYLSALDDKTLTDLCKYLNLWLDEQKNTHIKGISEITEEQLGLIDNLWNDLDAYEDRSKCKRHQDKYSISDKEKHMKLLTYCINRDHIKELCENVIKYTGRTQNVCSALSKYTDTYYEEFKTENPCLDNSVKDDLYRYYVSEDCSLYDMPKTFPEYNPQKRQILYENNSRTAINKCISTTESVSPVAEEKRVRGAENGAGAEEKPAETEDADLRSGLDDDPAHLTKLRIQLRTDHLNGEDAMATSMDGNTIEANMQPKLGTIGATLAGSSLFLIMMYKYTPFGSWVSTKILRKDKLMDNMNKNNYELLLNDVGNREGSINDTMYNIRYNNISNR